MHLHAIRALRVLLRALSAHLTYERCVPYLRVLHALFARLKIFSGWIFSLSKTFNFPKTIKGTANYAVFVRVEKEP